MGFLLNGVIDALVHRRRRRGTSALRHFTGGRGSFLNASTLLGAAGLAWGLYEVAQSKKAGTSSSGAASTGPRASSARDPVGREPDRRDLPPIRVGNIVVDEVPPLPSAAPSPAEAFVPDEFAPEVATELRITRLLIAAARVDGQIGEEELEHILGYARAAGVESALREEWNSPRPLAEIVAGARDPQHKRDLYALAYGVLRADEDVRGAERIFLAQLAAQLGLDAETTKRLERETDRSIDSPRA